MIFKYLIPKEIEIDIKSFWNMCLEYNTDDLPETEYLCDVVLEDLAYYIECYIHIHIDEEINEYSLYELEDALVNYVI